MNSFSKKLKRNIIITAILMIAGTNAANTQVTYGVRAGISGSALSKPGNLYDGHKYNPGLQLGATIEYNFTNILSLETGLVYQDKGGKSITSIENGIQDATIELDYLTIPLTAKASFSEQLGLESGWGIYGLAGPYYSLLIDQHISISEISADDLSAEEDFGLLFGIGISRDVNQFEVYSDIRYENSLNDILSFNKELRNKAVTWSIGINF